MNNTNQTLAWVSGGAILLNALGGLAQDWPQWRGANRDAKASGFTAPATWPKELTQKWKVTVGLGDAAPALVGNKLFVFARQGDDEINLCLDAATGKELWSNPDNGVQFNTPVLKNGALFGLSAKDLLFCITVQDGKTAWTAPSGGRRGFGSIVDAGSVLMALTPASQLLVFEPSDKEYKQLASIKVADKETYAYPVLAGNRLFVKDQDSLTLWTID